MSERILMEYGQAIRRMRQKKSMSQERLADLCGLHRTYISDIELGKRNVSLENIERMSMALGMKISELFVEVEADASI